MEQNPLRRPEQQKEGLELCVDVDEVSGHLSRFLFEIYSSKIYIAYKCFYIQQRFTNSGPVSERTVSQSELSPCPIHVFFILLKDCCYYHLSFPH